MKAWLIYPPFAPFEQPPLGTSLLVGYARAVSGWSIGHLDLNVESFDALLSSGSLRQMSKRFADISLMPTLDPMESFKYKYLSLLSAASAEGINDVKRKIRSSSILQSSYWQVKRALQVGCMILSESATLGRRGFDCTDLRSLIDLVKCCEGDPICEFIRHKIQEIIVPSAPELIGISIIFPSQIPYGLYVGKVAKQLTAAQVVIGGPTFSGIAKDGQIPLGLFDLVDYLVVGDGCAPLIDLLADLHPPYQQEEAAKGQ